jgi:hypothetical protein
MLSEGFCAVLEIASRLCNGNQVAFNGLRSGPKIRNLGHLRQLIDTSDTYRECPLGQLSLHLVKARLFGVIAFYPRANSKKSAPMKPGRISGCGPVTSTVEISSNVSRAP